jgi:hypothetical protein
MSPFLVFVGERWLRSRAMGGLLRHANERFTQITTLRVALALEAERLKHQAHTFPAGKNATLLCAKLIR